MQRQPIRQMRKGQAVRRCTAADKGIRHRTCPSQQHPKPKCGCPKDRTRKSRMVWKLSVAGYKFNLYAYRKKESHFLTIPHKISYL